MKKVVFTWKFDFTTTKFMAYLLIPYSIVVTYFVRDAMIPITAMGSISVLLGVNKYAEVKMDKNKQNEQPQ